MYNENIKKQELSLEQRGIPSHSHFVVEFQDGSFVTENEVNWSDISEETIVDHFGIKKIGMVCTHPIKCVTINHAGSSITIVPNEGEQIYQAIKSNAVLQNDGQTLNRIVGRVIGRIKDGVVLEEQMINQDGLIFGIRS
jgi:hypothetical protein